jgi:hypothetical protein
MMKRTTGPELNRTRSLLPALVTACIAVILCGCGQTSPSSLNGTAVPAPAKSTLAGRVKGGQQPVSNATVQLYQVGTSGDGSASTTLGSSTVTDGNGSFNLSGLYTCPASDPLVYMLANGGNPGLAAGANNTAIAILVALGPCNSLGPNTDIYADEVTTVAAVAALAPYMTSPLSIGSGLSDASAFASAFTLAAEFANIASGSSPGTSVPSGSTVPTTLINTLSDVISACVNSAGGVAGDDSICGNLFVDATPPGGTAPTNIATALLDIANNPTNNAAALYGLASVQPPFLPALDQAPASWAIALIPSNTTLTMLSPSSALAGSGALSVGVTGTNFTASSVVQVNGVTRATTFVSSTSLTAQFIAADTAIAGYLAVTVVTPAPGGTTSAMTFTVNNPVPALSTISPANTVVNDMPFTLTVTGSNFVAGSQVLWNGALRTTTYSSPTKLLAEINASDLNTAGTPSVSVFNPTPGGGTSGAATFAIEGPTATSFSSCTDVDINVTGSYAKGSASVSGSTVTVSGSGSDINNATDSFNFCYVPVVGNFQMIVQMNQPTSTASLNAGAKVGIMVRESTSSSSRFEMLYMNPTTGELNTNRRLIDGATAFQRTKDTDPASSFPYWLRLQRYGDEISLDAAPDGVTWTSVLSFQSLVGLQSNVLIGLASTSRTTSTINTTFNNVSLTPITTPTQPVTSWLGNTYPGSGTFMIYRGQGIANDPAGNVFVTGQGEAESGDFLDTNGNFLIYPPASHYNTNLGIAYDPTNQYIWMSEAPFGSGSSTALGGISYSKIDGVQLGQILQTRSGNTETAARAIYGLAVYGTTLYAIDGANQATPSDTTHVTVHTINLASSSFPDTAPFLVPAGATYVAADTSGNLWMVFTGSSPYVEKYDHLGNDLGVELTGFIDPRGIATDAANNVYVTDYNAAVQQIFVFNPAGSPLATLGAPGGIYSTCNGTIPGQYDPCKLDHPEGISLDASGNLYVASDGPPTITFGNSGMVLRKYSNVANNLAAGLSSANLAWHREGLDYLDTAATDPQSETDLYDKLHHYKMDYSQPPGQGWSLQGLTLDDLHYPNDLRGTVKYEAGSWIRYINGQKYLIVNDQTGYYLNFYRFTAGSEIAIPYASFLRENARGKSGDAFTIWIDTNLNGVVDPGETQSLAPPPAAPPSAEYWDWYVDANGDVWTPSGTDTKIKILRYPATIGSNGYVSYSTANVVSYSAPPAFSSSSATTIVTRTRYVPSTDTMFLAGYTAADPKLSDYSYGLVGMQVLRYDNFTTNPTLGCTINIPPVIVGITGDTNGDGTKAIDVAGNLLGVTTDFSNKVVLYSTQGACPEVTEFTPGPEVGGTQGTTDSLDTFNMYYRGPSTNEYDIFAEEGGQHKIIMYRYIYP